MYLANPGFLRLVFRPIYSMKAPYNNREAIDNINQVQNILASVRTANLIEQITGSDYQEMVAKCILNRRLDIYTNAWSKYAQDQEKEEPEQEESTSVGEALRNLSIRVNSLKQATMIVSQVNFFIKHLKVELEQLNLLETRAGNDQRQNGNKGRFQANQGMVRPRYQSFNNVQQGMSNFQQAYQGFQNPQQQMVQNP